MNHSTPPNQNGRTADPLHVCVIGAGVCGLVSVKACLEAGLRVTCFDRTTRYGGLWNYSEASEEEEEDADQVKQFEPSVMRTTILNTGKELSSFSDYPPPAQLPNFMRHNLYMDYIHSYVAQNKLLPHIKLQHEIIHVEPTLRRCSGLSDTAGKTGTASEISQPSSQQRQTVKWLVRVRDLKTQNVFETQFDRLLLAVGHHIVPYEPQFPNQHKFLQNNGKIIHSAKFKDILTDKRVQNKRVLIIGLGNSACDAACDLSLVSEKCYLSCHRGTWILNRLTPDNFYDLKKNSRLYSYLGRAIPTKLSDKFIIKKLESRTNHRQLGLTPLHKPSEQIPAINDLVPYRILTGGITLKSSVATFTENGVIFEGEPDQEYPVDLVILATGYKSLIPFLDEHALGFKSKLTNLYELYLNMFAPNLTLGDSESELDRLVARSVAFIGLVQPTGSITVVSELQARYAVQVFLDRLELPPRAEMLKHVGEIQRRQSRSVRSHSRDLITGDWVGYLDMIAKRLGVKPNMSKMFFKDFQLWKQLMFGPSVPYQYRLIGPHKWTKARETILSVDERIYQGINEGKNHLLFQTRRKCLNETTTTTTTTNEGKQKANEKKLQ